MTTEEMNIKIAEYMGGKILTFENNPYTFVNFDDTFKNTTTVASLKYHSDWTTLIPVWQKLRGELNPRQYKLDGHFRTDNRLVNLRVRIKEAITEEDTPTTAHRLMVEAIELIKK